MIITEISWKWRKNRSLSRYKGGPFNEPETGAFIETTSLWIARTKNNDQTKLFFFFLNIYLPRDALNNLLRDTLRYLPFDRIKLRSSLNRLKGLLESRTQRSFAYHVYTCLTSNMVRVFFCLYFRRPRPL